MLDSKLPNGWLENIWHELSGHYEHYLPAQYTKRQLQNNERKIYALSVAATRGAFYLFQYLAITTSRLNIISIRTSKSRPYLKLNTKKRKTLDVERDSILWLQQQIKDKGENI